jgi:TorA maturation chaperone TorD
MISLEGAYRFLTAVFHEPPTLAFLTSFAAENWIDEWPLNPARKETQIGLRLMGEFCAAWNESRLPDLESDFNRLFVGPGQPLAPPWESYYLSRDHLLFQEQTLAVRQAYRRFGLEAPHLHSEPDDSLSLELSFMAELCARCSAASDTGPGRGPGEIIEAQRQFLASHLLRWAPQCLRQVIESARLDYYRAGAFLGLGCLLETAAVIGTEVPAPGVPAHL